MSRSLSEQLSVLVSKPAHDTLPPRSRYEAKRAEIASVPVHRRNRRSLERYRLRLEPCRSNRDRTVFRLVKAAAPALLVRDFDTYNRALEYSRSIGGHKPIRRDNGACWRVVCPNLSPTVAEWADVGPWHPPFRSYCDPSSIAETLDSIPDFSEG